MPVEHASLQSFDKPITILVVDRHSLLPAGAMGVTISNDDMVVVILKRSNLDLRLLVHELAHCEHELRHPEYKAWAEEHYNGRTAGASRGHDRYDPSGNQVKVWLKKLHEAQRNA